ncbi:efflux RND transporter periplasmic adaptor subunit [Ruegeria marina]|uniref:RND family efflux transporter, MFP subunit n=1 Tax=Ruegeria marina TaxID=639004 RepID=A0A1G7DZ20_9RHOB|nr:HlyD family efflux transporter periplasmic adaptor subunit [Ruegeria marina]SDE56723.1 RND family efflux transporter, MFP subunit [Ruegeria marina]
MGRFTLLWMLPPLAIGAAAAAWFISQASGPAQVPAEAPGQAVHVQRAQVRDIRPTVRAWGNVRAAEHWTAIAEVRGTVIWRHDNLEPGRVIAAGDEVLRLDPADHDLAIAQFEADLTAFAAEVAQIEAEAANTGKVLALERARLALLDSDLARVRDLVAQGAAPRARADETERGVLAARRVVTELENSLALIPSRQMRLTAQVARTEAALAGARRDLENTRIAVPYDLRVTQVQAERFQFMSIGQPLFAGDAIDRVEVVAQIPIPGFRRLLSGAPVTADVLSALQAGVTWPIDAELRLIGDPSQVWQGKVTRIEGALDPRARTVPVVVEVTDPYQGAAPPFRVPLVPNMQMEVTLTGATLAGVVTIPESALHGDLVYIADEADRLILRPVTLAFRQDGIAAIVDGLSAGTRVVTDDIAPAIPGMVLRPVEAVE